MRFTLNGEHLELIAEDVQNRLRDVSPEPVQEYGVRIGFVLYPVKQAFEAATGVPRRGFTTQVARRQFAALGFELVAAGQLRPATITPQGNARSGEGPMARRVPLCQDQVRHQGQPLLVELEG